MPKVVIMKNPALPNRYIIVAMITRTHALLISSVKGIFCTSWCSTTFSNSGLSLRPARIQRATAMRMIESR